MLRSRRWEGRHGVAGGRLLLFLFFLSLPLQGIIRSSLTPRQGCWEHTNVFATPESLAEVRGGGFLAKVDGMGCLAAPALGTLSAF